MRSRRAALPKALVVAAAGAICAGRVGFVNPGVHKARAPAAARAATNSGDEEQTWQQGLDKALLDVDATPEERLKGLAKAASSPLEIAQAFTEAAQAIADKGIGKGHPDALDALFPKGTIARNDLEGLAAVARQTPELVEGLQGASQQAGSAPSPASSSASAPKAPELNDVQDAVSKLLSPDTLREVSDEARNIFRRTPAGLEEPAYEVVASGDGYEVRRYERFAVAKRRMKSEKQEGFSSGEGFTALAGYLFGDNDKEQAMKMTMPVNIDYDDASPEAREMLFVLPSEDAAAEGGPPKPRDPTVEIDEVPERLVAVREFPGIATDKEVERQNEKLIAALEEDGLHVPEKAGQYSVLQYNPPYTLPWRRRNEIAIVVVPGVQDAEVVAVDVEVQVPEAAAPAEAAAARGEGAPPAPEPEAEVPETETASSAEGGAK